MALESGTRLGPYEIVSLLGKGGMGEVYRANDTRLNRDVAVKVLPAEFSQDPTFRQRFEREAKTISQLQHPNVCTLHDVGSQDGADYLVMEYLEGNTLEDRLRNGPLPIDDVLRIGGEIAEAIEAAHRRGIVHRDLKPGNVMLTETGSKVLDFGLAREATRIGDVVDTQAATVPAITGEGTIVGTMPYMAPEQLQGSPADSRTDLWALGCILYEMATGDRAFQGKSQADLIGAIMGAQPDAPSRKQPLVPESLDHLVQRCLEKDPDRRWHSAKDLSLELQSLGGREVPAEELKGGRGPWRLVAIGAVLAAVVAGAAWVTSRMPSDDVERASPVADAGTRIVVLPFENRGSLEDEEHYFAGGLTEEVTSRLGKLDGLSVISRSTAAEYLGRSIREIRDDLNVDWVLSGSVQWASGEEVLIRTTLIQTADNTEAWSATYYRTIDDAFVIQLEISTQVSQQLDLSFLSIEVGGPRPTPAAYDAFMRGVEARARRTDQQRDLQLAVDMFQKAVDLDPSFALAWAKLSEAHSGLVVTTGDRRPETLDSAKQAAEEALRLSPDLPEAHQALGAYFWGQSDYDKAISEYELAVAGLPNDGDTLGSLAWLHWRSGDIGKFVELQERVRVLSPRSGGSDLAFGYMYLREYEKAQPLFDQAVQLAPDDIPSLSVRAWNSELWKGPEAALVDGWPETFDPGAIHARFRAYLGLGRYEDAREQIDLLPPDGFVDIWGLEPKSYLLARWYEARGEQELADREWNSARRELEELLQRRPDDDRVLASLGVTYAKLGLETEAVESGERGLELGGPEKDAVTGPIRLLNLAKTYALVGDHESALDSLQELLKIPAPASVVSIDSDPDFDSLKALPRYQRLVEEQR